MRQFERQISYEEVKAACEEKALALDDTRYRGGSDYVRIVGTLAGTTLEILYAPHNGTFFGETAGGVRFNSSSDVFDGERWFDAVLALLYTRPVVRH